MKNDTATPIRAIRLKCLDCTCHQVKEVRLCPIRDCALHPYRMGRRPTTAHDVAFAEKSATYEASLSRREADNGSEA